MNAPRPVKPRAIVEVLYTFGSLVLLAACTPILLLIGFGFLAWGLQLAVNDTQVYTAMKNALVLTEVLLVIGIPLLVAGHVVARHVPVQPPVKHKGGTQTNEVQIPPDVKQS